MFISASFLFQIANTERVYSYILILSTFIVSNIEKMSLYFYIPAHYLVQVSHLISPEALKCNQYSQNRGKKDDRSDRYETGQEHGNARQGLYYTETISSASMPTIPWQTGSLAYLLPKLVTGRFFHDPDHRYQLCF